MVRIILVFRGAFGDQKVGDALHVLPGDAEHAGDLRYGMRPADAALITCQRAWVWPTVCAIASPYSRKLPASS